MSDNNVVKGAAGIGIAAALIFSLGNLMPKFGLGIGFGSGTGNGNGNGDGNGSMISSETVAISDNTDVNAADSNNEAQNAEEFNTDMVTIKINENSVTVGTYECKNEEEFRAYIQEIYTDETIWVLEEDHAIEETYDWVIGACDDLGVDLLVNERSVRNR